MKSFVIACGIMLGGAQATLACGGDDKPKTCECGDTCEAEGNCDKCDCNAKK